MRGWTFTPSSNHQVRILPGAWVGLDRDQGIYVDSRGYVGRDLAPFWQWGRVSLIERQ
jgi:hypothetical protein